MMQAIMYVFLLFTVFGLTSCTTLQDNYYNRSGQIKILSQEDKDKKVEQYIHETVKHNHVPNIASLKISVVNGEVLAMGVVKTPLAKKRIQDIILSQRNITKVYNKIIVDFHYDASSYMNDSLVANMIRGRILVNKDAYLSKVDVEVFKNRVYLLGEVATFKEKALAEYVARTGKGVQSVYSFIRIKK